MNRKSLITNQHNTIYQVHNHILQQHSFEGAQFTFITFLGWLAPVSSWIHAWLVDGLLDVDGCDAMGVRSRWVVLVYFRGQSGHVDVDGCGEFEHKRERERGVDVDGCRNVLCCWLTLIVPLDLYGKPFLVLFFDHTFKTMKTIFYPSLI